MDGNPWMILLYLALIELFQRPVIYTIQNRSICVF